MPSGSDFEQSRISVSIGLRTTLDLEPYRTSSKVGSRSNECRSALDFERYWASLNRIRAGPTSTSLGLCSALDFAPHRANKGTCRFTHAHLLPVPICCRPLCEKDALQVKKGQSIGKRQAVMLRMFRMFCERPAVQEPVLFIAPGIPRLSFKLLEEAGKEIRKALGDKAGAHPLEQQLSPQNIPGLFSWAAIQKWELPKRGGWKERAESRRLEVATGPQARVARAVVCIRRRIWAGAEGNSR